MKSVELLTEQTNKTRSLSLNVPGLTPGPKISFFLTLPNIDSGCALPEVYAGNMEKILCFYNGMETFLLHFRGFT